MEAKQLYEFDKDLTGGIPIRQMIGTFDIYKLRWNKKRNEENANRKKSITFEIDRDLLGPSPVRDPFGSAYPCSEPYIDFFKAKKV